MAVKGTEIASKVVDALRIGAEVQIGVGSQAFDIVGAEFSTVGQAIANVELKEGGELTFAVEDLQWAKVSRNPNR